MPRSFISVHVGSIIVGSVVFAAQAHALDQCPSFSNKVVVVGSTAIKPLLAEVAKIVVAGSSQDAAPATVLYVGGGSCIGVDAALNGTAQKPDSVAYWDANGVEQACAPATGVDLVADIGVSDVFASTCTALPNGLPSNVVDFQGPVQAMTFVVPQASSQESISAEAAYYVFGFGNDSGVEPWTDESFIFQRNDQSGTQRMLAAAIGVDASRWFGTKTASSSEMRQSIITAGSKNAEATLGILSADEADANRATLKVLAFQDLAKSCGYYPDRDVSSNEKQSVREGDYPIWGPMHLLATVDNTQRPRNPLAADIVAYIIGTKAPPAGLDLVALEAQRHVVPQCAMRVRRTQEMGRLSPFSPDEPCGCYYEKLANGSTSCQACAAEGDCDATSICAFGFCEKN